MLCAETIGDMRALIRQTKKRDINTRQLHNTLEHRARQLHGAILLPDDQPAEALQNFTLRYIENLPDLVEAIRHLTQEAGIYQRMVPLLLIACDYLLSPPDLATKRAPHSHGLMALLEEAYLAHRLLEEINDRFISHCGIPLAPLDTTRANVIAHELIGEPFANELDQAVLFSAELLLSEHAFEEEGFKRYTAQHRNRQWSEDLRRWPCFAADLEVGLKLNT